MLTGTLFGLLLVMRLFPRTAAGRLLHRWLVVLPLERLAWVKRRHLIFVAILFALLFFASEALLVTGGGELGMLLAWDVSAYVDMLVVSLTVAATARLRPLWVLGGPAFPRRRARPRARSARHRRSPAKASDDEDQVWNYALAA